jgi:hypothetical protein
MRDVKRIDRILKKIGIIWKRTPDQRLFQLLFNYTRLQASDKVGYVRDPFHYEDDDIEADLDKVIEQIEASEDEV